MLVVVVVDVVVILQTQTFVVTNALLKVVVVIGFLIP